MKPILFILLLTIAIVIGLPRQGSPKSKTIPIIQYDRVDDKFGQYAVRYVSGDGTIVDERGYLKPNSRGSGCVLAKEGSASYYSPEGKIIAFSYVADENGFRPKGDHIPSAA